MQALLLAVTLSAFTGLQGDGDLYRVTLVRATPGGLLELIDHFRARPDRLDRPDRGGEAAPFIIRHSQGDQWDLMVVYPVADLHAHFAPERVERRAAAAREGAALVAWQEDTFFIGPPHAESAPRFRDAGYFHVEMFVALPGKRDALLREREMENEYLEGIGRRSNAIFTKVLGGAWDSMTIGFYRDIKHYAESADIPAEVEERAARAAGFDGADRIGTYLRTLIASHHDTLGTAVR